MSEHVHSDSLSMLFSVLSEMLSNKVVSSLLSAFVCLLPFVPMFTYKQLLNVSWWTSLWRSFLAILLSFASLAIVIILLFGLFYGIDAVS